jgi:hypothetical protein
VLAESLRWPELAQVSELSRWAERAGDEDVVSVCRRALAGDTTALEEALDWWNVWSAIHRPSVRSPSVRG